MSAQSSAVRAIGHAARQVDRGHRRRGEVLRVDDEQSRFVGVRVVGEADHPALVLAGLRGRGREHALPGGAARAEQPRFAYPAPGYHEAYRTFFGEPVSFDAPFSGFGGAA